MVAAVCFCIDVCLGFVSGFCFFFGGGGERRLQSDGEKERGVETYSNSSVTLMLG